MRYYVAVWFILFGGWILVYFIRISFSPALPLIINELSISHGAAGLLANSYFYAYTMMQLPAGYLGEKFGRKRMLITAALLWSATSFLTAEARSYEGLFAARFASGISHGLYFSNDRPLVSSATPKEKVGLGQGVSFTGPSTGMALGLVISGWVAELMGWRLVFYLLAIPPLIMAGVFAVMLREPKGGADLGRGVVSRAALLRRRAIWLIYLGGIPGMYAVWVLGIWLPTALLEYGVKSVALVSGISALVGAAGVPGLVLLGFLGDRLWRRGVARGWLIGGAGLVMAASLYLLGLSINTGQPLLVIVLLIAVAGFFHWGAFAPMYALMSHHVSPIVLGTAFGLMNGIHFTGSLVSPWMTGLIRDVTGSFTWGFYAASLFLLVSAACFLLETKYEKQ